MDVRLNNVSQLAGFAKKDDLAYFAKEICGMDYLHLPALAPTKEMLDRYKKAATGRITSGSSSIGCDNAGSRRRSQRRKSRTVACFAAKISPITATGDLWRST